MSLTSYDLAGPDPKPMTVREVDALKSLVTELPWDPIVVQIGAERGCSTLAMLEERPDLFIISIDIGKRPEERQHLIEAGLEWQRVVRLLGRSQDVGKFWPIEWEPHMLYVDGDHRYSAVVEDIAHWSHHVREGGVIAFHDYIPDPIPDHIVGRVAYAVDEWLEQDPHEEILWTERLRAFRA